MAVSIIGPKFYAWGRDGKPLAFGKLFTYQARTNVPKATYQSEDAQVENTNPVILNGEGYANVYLVGSYKMVLKDESDNEIWSSDPVSSNMADEWINCVSASYISSTSFRIVGNFTDIYTSKRKIRLDNNTAGFDYTDIESSSYSSGETTVIVRDPLVKTGLIQACASIVSPLSSFNSSDVGNVSSFESSSVSDMIQGRVISGDTIEHKVGQVWSSGSTRWKVASTPIIDISNFTPLNGVWSGDFSNIQNAINAGIASNSTIVLSENTVTSGVQLSQSAKINLNHYELKDDGTLSNPRSVITITSGKLTLKNGDIRLSDNYTAFTQFHCIEINGDSYCDLENINTFCGAGDGVYIFTTSTQRNVLKKVVSTGTNLNRNGFSLISGTAYYYQCEAVSNGFHGFDIEPGNESQILGSVIYSDCHALSNGGGFVSKPEDGSGFALVLGKYTSQSRLIEVSYKGCSSKGNRESGYLLLDLVDETASGFINFVGCSANDCGKEGLKVSSVRGSGIRVNGEVYINNCGKTGGSGVTDDSSASFSERSESTTPFSLGLKLSLSNTDKGLFLLGNFKGFCDTKIGGTSRPVLLSGSDFSEQRLFINPNLQEKDFTGNVTTSEAFGYIVNFPDSIGRVLTGKLPIGERITLRNFNSATKSITLSGNTFSDGTSTLYTMQPYSQVEFEYIGGNKYHAHG